ncbi:MAG: hypothetical protein AAGL66_16065, partial [Pseudomonadota bacterium]
MGSAATTAKIKQAPRRLLWVVSLVGIGLPSTSSVVHWRRTAAMRRLGDSIARQWTTEDVEGKP